MEGAVCKSKYAQLAEANLFIGITWLLSARAGGDQSLIERQVSTQSGHRLARFRTRAALTSRGARKS